MIRNEDRKLAEDIIRNLSGITDENIIKDAVHRASIKISLYRQSMIRLAVSRVRKDFGVSPGGSDTIDRVCLAIQSVNEVQ